MVSLASEEDAQAIRDRIEAGEDMGTIAQTESLDIQSRQEDGLTQPTPPELYADSAQEALADQPVDTLVGPIQVGNNWWVARIERVQDDGTYSDTQRDQLATVDLTDLIDQQRESLDIEKNLTNSDIEWAYRHVDAVPASGS